MILLTVGTVMPFDRLVKSVDELISQGTITEEVFGQIGHGAYIPHSFEYARELTIDVFEEHFRHADKIVGHAGIGTIVMSLQCHKPLLVMPRRKKHSEHVNDHQLGTAHKFEAKGHVLVAYSEEQLPHKLKALDDFEPVVREPRIEGIISRVTDFINSGS